VLGITGLITYVNTRAVSQASTTVIADQVALTHLEQLISQLKDAETGQRGYIITGNPEYLDPYESALHRLAQAFQQVRQSTAGNPQQQQQLDRLHPLIAEKLSVLKLTIALRQRQGFAAAAQVVQTDRGKHLMDQIRQIVLEMELRL
jgi:hypothetical protein